MKEPNTWIIVDLFASKALYGADHITMIFSTREVADEVANNFFKSKSEYLLVQVFLSKMI